MQGSPAALDAACAAIEAKPAETANILVQRELAIRRTVHALVVAVRANPESEQAFRESLRENSDALAVIITKEPDLVGTMFKSIASKGLSRGSREFEVFMKAYAAK
jgi:hypothetical protein